MRQNQRKSTQKQGRKHGDGEDERRKSRDGVSITCARSDYSPKPPEQYLRERKGKNCRWNPEQKKGDSPNGNKGREKGRYYIRHSK